MRDYYNKVLSSITPGAIMLYLAEQYEALLPAGKRRRWD
jgi:hypothetical protein